MLRRLIVSAVVLAAAALAFWYWRPRPDAEEDAPRIPGDDRRITVEVLNGSGIDGLAAATTRHLRRRGLDVVYFGTAPADTFGATLILVRRGELENGERVRDALGFGTVGIEPDPRLLLDVSVILGRDAASQDFRP